jgi:hypothetical protein
MLAKGIVCCLYRKNCVCLSKIRLIIQHFWKKKQAQVSTENKPYICFRQEFLFRI